MAARHDYPRFRYRAVGRDDAAAMNITRRGRLHSPPDVRTPLTGVPPSKSKSRPSPFHCSPGLFPAVCSEVARETTYPTVNAAPVATVDRLAHARFRLPGCKAAAAAVPEEFTSFRPRALEQLYSDVHEPTGVRRAGKISPRTAVKVCCRSARPYWSNPPSKICVLPVPFPPTCPSL